MSSILKALEKVEESQTRRNAGPTGLARGRQRRSPWLMAGGVLGGAAVAALATFAAMGGFSRHGSPQAQQVADAAPSVAVAPQASPVPALQAQAPVAAAPPAAAQKGAQHQSLSASAQNGSATVSTVKAASPAKTASAKAPTAKVAPAKAAAAKSATAKTARVEAAQPAASKVAATATVKATTKRTAKAPAVTTKAETAHIAAAPRAVSVAKSQPEKQHAAPRVTGIAWQNDGASSVAMVNGKAVQQGATVDGYRVEQIYEDKVRFSGSNGKMEVPLGGGE